jgi:hypothetical protein
MLHRFAKQHQTVALYSNFKNASKATEAFHASEALFAVLAMPKDQPPPAYTQKRA